jgi:hypothetical protein
MKRALCTHNCLLAGCLQYSNRFECDEFAGVKESDGCDDVTLVIIRFRDESRPCLFVLWGLLKEQNRIETACGDTVIRKVRTGLDHESRIRPKCCK